MDSMRSGGSRASSQPRTASSTLKSVPRTSSALAQKRQQLYLREFKKNRLPVAREKALVDESEQERSTRMSEQGRREGQEAKRMSKEVEERVWGAFGRLVARMVAEGRAVQVPKFGVFTFTAADVDLKGTTNQGQRDRQERVPVFVVAKEFAGSIDIKPGIKATATGQIRPYQQQGVSGIIPQTKMNYCELAASTGLSKDVCREACEWVFRQLADQTRKGQAVKKRIPEVGELQIQRGLAGVVFEPRIAEQALGKTAKQYALSLFQTNNNLMNERLFETDRNRQQPARAPSASAKSLRLSKPPLPRDSRAGLQKLQLDKLPAAQSEYGLRAARRDEEQSEKENVSRVLPVVNAASRSGRRPLSSQQANPLLNRGFIRDSQGSMGPRSVFSSLTRVSQASAVSHVPDLAPFQLMSLASNVFAVRKQVCDLVLNRSKQKSNQGKQLSVTSLRDTLSSSQILKLLNACRVRIEIGHVKALLKELGFNWNGPACSLAQFFSKVSEYLNPAPEKMSMHDSQPTAVPNRSASLRSQKTAVVGEKFKYPEDQNTLLKLKLGLETQSKSQSSQVRLGRPLLDVIKELLYQTQKPLHHLYREVCTGDQMEEGAFWNLVAKYSNGCIPRDQTKDVFFEASKRFRQPYHLQVGGKTYLTFQEFEKHFELGVKDPDVFRNEAKVVLAVKEWMAARRYSAEEAFERLLRSGGRENQRALNRYEFQKAIVANGLKLMQPEIDFLFDVLTGFRNLSSTLLGQRQWLDHILDEKGSSLQVLRQLVQRHGLNKDNILNRLEVKLWDPPLYKEQFATVLRRLDPNLGQSILDNLFEKLVTKQHFVEIPTLVNNLCGTEHETINYQVQLFKELYVDLFLQNRQREFLSQCERTDKRNDGTIAPNQLIQVLEKVTGGDQPKYSKEVLQKFVKQLDKDPITERINYVEILNKITGHGNKDHDPFKSVIQSLELFLKANNNMSAEQLLSKLGAATTDGVDVEKFASFLKSKVAQSRNLEELQLMSYMIDIDKDGFISKEDLQTCLSNLNSAAFFKDGGKALQRTQFNSKYKFFKVNPGDGLSDQKLQEVRKQIVEKMKQKQYDYRLLFQGFDTDGDGLLTYAEFRNGMKSLITLSDMVLEKLYALMDSNGTGMVDEQQFLTALDSKAPVSIVRKVNLVEDDFKWQEDAIKGIKRYVRVNKLTPLQAFQQFDQDFDGFISKQDMRASLEKYVEIPAPKLTETRINRLFRLLSFYKTESLQPSDFDRLFEDVNPYLTAIKGEIKNKFKQSMGGGFTRMSTFDWKLSAIQQIGMQASRIYGSSAESFKAASRDAGKVNLPMFTAFVEKHNLLEGFDISASLLQQLYGELDPHRKTYLTLQDWQSAFDSFDEKQALIVELKNCLQCQFANVQSAFNYFQTFNGEELIDFETFAAAVRSLINNRKYTEAQLKHMFKSFLREPTDYKAGFNFQRFSYEFEHLKFKGKQSIVAKTNPNNKGGFVTTVQSGVNPKWQQDIIAKLRSIIGASNKSIERIFDEFDEDGSGTLSQQEFRHALRKLQLGLKSTEIDQVLQRIDQNKDGVIDYREFFNVLGQGLEQDKIQMERANNRLAWMKENMQMYMTSHGDAYRNFDKSKVGRMAFVDFSTLVAELARVSSQPTPAYAVIKDLFDAVDIKKDGYIDLNEWNNTFNQLKRGGQASSFKPTPLSNWENSEEFNLLGEVMTRNRKLLIEKFRQQSTEADDIQVARLKENKGTLETVMKKDKLHYVTLPQAKKALQDVLLPIFENMKKAPKLTDDKISHIMQPGALVEVPHPLKAKKAEQLYDFVKALDLFKARYKSYV